MNSTSKASALFSLGRPFTSLLGAVAIFAASFVGAGTNLGEYWAYVILGVLIGYLFTTASNASNDYCDRNEDKINHPERPIPSGRIGVKTALAFSSAVFGLSIVLAAVLATLVGAAILIVFLAALGVQVAYDLKVKKTKIVGNLFIGFQTVLAFLFGGVIVGNLDPVAFMATASFLAITAREVVKDVEDIKGDANKTSLPKLIGIKKANIIALALISAAIGISVVAYYPLHILGLGYFVLILVADAVFIGSMPLLFKNPNAARKSWRYAMMLALIAFVVGGVM